MSRMHLLAFIAAFSLTVSISLADYVDADARLYARNGTNVTVTGYIRFDNFSTFNYTNVTGHMGSSNFTVFPNSSSNWGLGYYELNVTAPNTTGRFNVSLNITLTNGTVLREDIEIRVGGLSNATLNFTRTRPPFTNGSSFDLNVSFGGSSPSPPKLEIFNPNGMNSSGWAANNLSSRINTNSILYNITVPVGADGRYVLMFDDGLAATIFLVKSSVVAIADMQDTANSTTTTYGQGEIVNIIGRVRDENNAITNANVNAFVTLPNGTILNFTLIHNGTGVDGAYNRTFNLSEFGNLAGSYNVEIVANASGRIVKSTSRVTVQTLEAELDIVKDFFFDFGSSSAFQRGGIVEFNALVYNISTDVLLNGSTTTNAGAEVNCTAVRAVELKNVINGSTLSLPSLTKSLSLFVGQNVCKIRFTAPNADGIYSLTVNASVGSSQTNNLSVLATGYFSIQSYILKPSPVSSFGSGHEFLSFLMPGDNATFELAVRNLSASGGAVAGSLITNFNVTKITPMSFTGGGQSEITAVQVLEMTNGTVAANPKIKLRVPDNNTGPFQIEFQATVGGSVVRGNSFYFARFVEGFVFPGGFGGGFGHGSGDHGGSGGEAGPPAVGSGGSFEGGSFRCSGAQNFSAKVFDVRTRQAAKSVTFNSIQEARDELTGRSLLSSISLVNSSSTDSDGIGNLTISFSGSFSGFNFILINITTSDGKSDSLPGGFECKQLSFFPDIRAIGSTSGGFYVAPTSGVNIIISSIRNLERGTSVTNGSVSIARLGSFDPSKGPRFIQGSSTSYSIINGTANLTLFPGNFSSLGGKWFNGFNDMSLQVCDNNNTASSADDVCDRGFGGFMVIAFDAFMDFSTSITSSVTANSSVVYRIMAKTNVTNFTAQIGQPWEGSLQDANVTNWSKISDGWNSPADNLNFSGFERWDVNLTMPTGMRKGFNMITIKVNNYLGESADVMTFASAAKLSVSVPDTEGVITTNNSAGASLASAAHVAGFRSEFRTDLSTLNLTFNGTFSKSGNACAIKDFNTTRFSAFQQGVSYGANITVFTLDNTSSGTYDVLVINNSGRIAVATTANRSLASANLPGLYLVSIESCGLVKILNTTISETSFGAGFGGRHQVNTTVTLPFIIKQGSKGKQGVVMDVSQMIVQEDFGGGRGGFGFRDFLPATEYRITTSDVRSTDANGVAFLRFSVNKTGSFSMLWNLSDAGDADTADFSQGVLLEVKSISTEGGVIPSFVGGFGLVTLAKNAAQTRNATLGNSPIFYGTWNESSQGVLIDDFKTLFHHIALRNVTHLGGTLTGIPAGAFTELVIDNDPDLNTTGGGEGGGDTFTPLRGNWTETLDAGFSAKVSAGGNQTVDENTTRLILASATSFFGEFIQNTGSSKNVTANVTVRACAYTFAQPRTPLIGANVSRLTTKLFSFSGPPLTQNLTIFNPFTNSAVTSVLTGPSGCAAFNITRPGGWTAGFSNEIKGRVVSGGSDEEVFIGSVFVGCPSSGSCF